MVQPANLPAGWIVLDPTTDMLPRFPDYDGKSLYGCQGVMPLFLDGTTVKAVTFTASSGDLSVADTTAWTASEWNAQGAEWMDADNSNKYVSLNWDNNE